MKNSGNTKIHFTTVKIIYFCCLLFQFRFVNIHFNSKERRLGGRCKVVGGALGCTMFVVVTGRGGREFYCPEFCLSVLARSSCKCRLET